VHPRRYESKCSVRLLHHPQHDEEEQHISTPMASTQIRRSVLVGRRVLMPMVQCSPRISLIRNRITIRLSWVWSPAGEDLAAGRLGLDLPTPVPGRARARLDRLTNRPQVVNLAHYSFLKICRKRCGRLPGCAALVDACPRIAPPRPFEVPSRATSPRVNRLPRWPRPSRDAHGWIKH